MIESTLLQTGAVGACFILVWRYMSSLTKRFYATIEAQNQERREMYQAQSELIKEVTAALVDKNHTDDKMSSAIAKLTDELRSTLKGSKNEES